MSRNSSFVKYRQAELTDDEDEISQSDSPNSIGRSREDENSQSEINSSSFITNTKENISEDEEIVGTDDESDSENPQNISEDDSSDQDIIIKKKKSVKRIESSDEEEEERRAVFSPRTRRSIHGFIKLPSGSEESDDESDISIKSNEISNIVSNSLEKTKYSDKETSNENSTAIEKFSNIYDSKSTVEQAETLKRKSNNNNGNESVHFDDSIANKLSSTLYGTPNIVNSPKNKLSPIESNNSNKSMEILEPKNDIIELSSSDEDSEQIVISTPTTSKDKKLLQPKISSIASSIRPPMQPEFVSAEYLNRELMKLDELNMELATAEKILKTNVNLPDNGKRMKERIENCKAKIKKQANYVSNLVVDENEIKLKRSSGIDNSVSSDDSNSSGINTSEQLPSTSNKSTNKSLHAPTWDELAKAVEKIQPKFTGEKGLATFAAQKAITVDRLKDIHGSLETCPNDSVLAKNPRALKIELMDHQKHALAWMQWREKQKPRGGILADDMGLGKTLTMISLILAQLDDENKDSEEEEEDRDSDEEWKSKGRRDYYNGGTLIVCPASLLRQWENEINNHVKRYTLNVVVHHGEKRETKAKHLAKHDVVITTYHIVSREYNTGAATLFQIKFDRIILDEAHMIRNHKAKISMSVCGLKAKNRWALTGTPVQNKEIDLYAIIKFLRCSPFDDLTHWKKWIDNKNAGGQARLNTLMKSLMLRRTKTQLQEKDDNFKLPDKNIELVEVILEKDEMNVYQRVMTYSQTLFAQFLHQRAEKENFDFVTNDNTPAFMQTKDPNGAFYKMHKKMTRLMGDNQEVKSFQILVLLLRLRQICCHCSLIDAMLEEEDLSTSGNSESHKEFDLLRQLEKLKIDGDEQTSGLGESSEDSGENSQLAKAAARVLSKNNPVFDKNNPSSKFKKILNVLEEKLQDNEKAIIVSQWTSSLELLQKHLTEKGYRTVSLNGKVPVKDRNEIVTEFNKEKNKTRIMLLSLTAGGVGLNLVGANHLFLIDLHWNPQLESQAQDRIYRVGQKKQVYIYKFMVKDTVEERIKHLQDKKLEIANGVLTGAKSTGSKLTLDDLRGLFGL